MRMTMTSVSTVRTRQVLSHFFNASAMWTTSLVSTSSWSHCGIAWVVLFVKTNGPSVTKISLLSGYLDDTILTDRNFYHARNPSNLLVLCSFLPLSSNTLTTSFSGWCLNTVSDVWLYPTLDQVKNIFPVVWQDEECWYITIPVFSYNVQSWKQWHIVFQVFNNFGLFWFWLLFWAFKKWEVVSFYWIM